MSSYAVGWAFFFTLVAPHDATQGQQPSEYGTGVKIVSDIICGPRCVQFVLEYFEHDDTELIDLVKEVQWPELEKGASLDMLNNALRNRGLNTLCVRVDADTRISWPFPVLVHLLEQGSSSGHYLVWLPTADNGNDEVLLWDGLAGVRREAATTFRSQRSGVILLIAPGQFQIPKQVDFSSGYDNKSTFLVVVVVLILGWMCCRASRIGRPCWRDSVSGFFGGTRYAEDS